VACVMHAVASVVYVGILSQAVTCMASMGGLLRAMTYRVRGTMLNVVTFMGSCVLREFSLLIQGLLFVPSVLIRIM
jgi:hypothetical protein